MRAINGGILERERYILALPVSGFSADTNSGGAEMSAPLGTSMSGVTPLTFEGDNGEACFSSDGRKLIYQSIRGGFDCDRIWTMSINGSDKKRVSRDHGTHTCSFYCPDNEAIVFAPASHLDGACPPKKKFPTGVCYAWPLDP